MLGVNDPNRARLRQVAEALHDILDEFVFLGGAAVGLLITDAAAPLIRVTNDVDCIVEVTSRQDYDGRVRNQLLRRGFAEMQGEGIPTCAWSLGGIRVDVMPSDEHVLGFSNRWYPAALEHPQAYELDGLRLPLITAPYFLATKLEAFFGRGGGDYVGSHDLEDIVAVVDGRASIVGEVQEAQNDVRRYLSQTFASLLDDPDFLLALSGHVIDPGRDAIVHERLESITRADEGT